MSSMASKTHGNWTELDVMKHNLITQRKKRKL